MDKTTCLCCGYRRTNPWDISVEGCHILELKTYNALDEDSKVEKCKALGITGVNDLQNIITLCKGCHCEFDKYEICIHPSGHRWIVGRSLREKTTFSGKTFSEIHSTLVPFPEKLGVPNIFLLEERMARFH